MKVSLFSLSAVVALTTLLVPASHALPASPSSNNVVTFDNHRVVRIQLRDDTQLKTLTANEDALAFDYFTHHKVVGDYVDVRISPQNFAKFQALKLEFTTLIENLQTVIEQEKQENSAYQMVFNAQLEESKKLNNGSPRILANGVTLPAGAEIYATDTWFQGYHSYADHQTWLSTQISANPGKASGFSAGKSFQGREQAGIKVGTGPNHIVFHGTQHSREWIGTMVVEYLIDQLLKGTDSRVAGYLQKYTFHIIPIMNPDGFVITQTSNRMHRKNAQTNGGCIGTDPNRNWGFKWGTGGSSSNPCNEDYKGPSAFSAPEAKNVADYLSSLPKVVSYIDFHSYSQLWMTPYGYTGTRPATYPYMSGLAAKAATALRAVHGTSYRYGDIFNTIYQASGSSVDYAYNIGVGAPFAVELRDTGSNGFSLPANQIIPSGEETWEAFAAILDGIQV
ncbi:hypothetical protein BGZ65_012700 [Modicella reniformis]|uniref:Carboxypeptidase M14A n=1 Tax=Modicella reniformis TaxID=1440133 RepID=A0A9P6MKE7_9FUNG|nr:hypothetical protein BGZ65_012700 [Modicella reniformis]